MHLIDFAPFFQGRQVLWFPFCFPSTLKKTICFSAHSFFSECTCTHTENGGKIIFEVLPLLQKYTLPSTKVFQTLFSFLLLFHMSVKKNADISLEFLMFHFFFQNHGLCSGVNLSRRNISLTFIMGSQVITVHRIA